MTLSYKPPAGWRFPAIEEIVLQEKGAIRIGPFGSALKKHEYSEAGVRVLGIEDVLPNQLVSDRRKFIPESKYRELSQYTVAPGDILVTNMGTVGRTCVVPGDLERSIISSHLIKVTFDFDTVWPSYISWMLNFCPLVVAQVKAKCHGAIMAGFNSSLLKQLRIPLPPLPEQRRIAAVLDRAEALRAKRRAALAQLDTLTQSIFLDMFGDPIANTRCWPKKKLSALGTLDRGVSKHRPRNAPELLGGPYPFVQTGDVANCNGYIRTFTSTYSDAGLRQSKMWPTGTLCITIAANIAKTGILTFDACFPDSVVGFSAEDPATVEFVRSWLSFLQASLEERAPESAQKNINLEILRGLEVPTPEVGLQQTFALRVAAVEVLRVAHRTSLAELDALFASLQHRAFRGDL